MTPAADRPPAGVWVQRWLSAPRYAVYLTEASDDPERALALYEWNAQLAAAVFRDLAHVEIALRNAYDAALTAWSSGEAHWTAPGTPLFAPLYRTRGTSRTDVNARSRAALDRARHDAGGPEAPPGKVVAELMFGFWRYLSSAAHEKTLWVPYLNRGFQPGNQPEGRGRRGRATPQRPQPSRPPRAPTPHRRHRQAGRLRPGRCADRPQHRPARRRDLPGAPSPVRSSSTWPRIRRRERTPAAVPALTRPAAPSMHCAGLRQHTDHCVTIGEQYVAHRRGQSLGAHVCTTAGLHHEGRMIFRVAVGVEEEQMGNAVTDPGCPGHTGYRDSDHAIAVGDLYLG